MANQKNCKAQICYGNPVTEEWDLVDIFDVVPSITPDVAGMTIEEIYKWQRGEWRKFNLPNGEVIEVQLVHNMEECTFILNVRQGSESLMQIICDTLTSVIFHTLSRAVIQIGYGAHQD
ncbi:hypothetical protein ACO0K9_06040 [Undibacterium sp. Ji50W]|uniref:hypothetical protein n=1 Tax=Undibacterium sp. Ji50W TaxID=3413041 RepID=UPI003BF34EA8